jgi:hypothetical protein
MYNSKFICTYNTSEVFLESDNISEMDKEFVRNALYREELLNIFNMEEYNEKEMNKSMHDLYLNLEKCVELNECMTKIAGKFISEDKELGLMILFSYDYMYLTHICVSEYLEKGEVSKKNIEKLNILLYF